MKNPHILDMKLSEIITQRLAVLGVERPSLRLTDELERVLVPKVCRHVNATMTRRLVARAFAATLAGKGGLGEHPQQAANPPGGTLCVACKSHDNATLL